ncbi:MAG: DUF5666 domain-containing protein [Dehalococcoidia bacterium]|nr:DUF5666 domain-containing protein [Dehalococcoidia bacterium]
MKRIVKMSLLMAAVAAVALTTIATALANESGNGPGPNHAEVKGIISAVGEAATSTPATVTIQPVGGPAVTLKVVASTLITKAGLGKTTLADLAVGDRAEAKYDKDSMEASKISVSHPVAKHRGYEGTIKSIASPALTSTSFVLTPKKGGDVTINVNAQTKYKVPGLKDASLSNFKAGDKVSVLTVEMNSGLMALDVHLIPGKPVHVQRVGTIVAYTAATDTPITAGSITIKDKKGASSTFVVTSGTKIKFKHGATAVTPGYKATVVARRNPATDQYTAAEILVFGPKANKDDGLKGNKDDGLKGNKDDGLKGNKDDGLKSNKDDGLKSNKDDGLKSNKDDGLKSNKDDGLKSNKDDGPKANKHDGPKANKDD